MSVAEHLGLHSPGSNELIRRARQQWPDWCRRDPRLAVVTDPLQVPRWTLAAERDRADDLLHALATLAAVDGGCGEDVGADIESGGTEGGGIEGGGAEAGGCGGGDPAAAMTLCWTLLPAAASVAHQLRGLTPDIDEAVASQLWLEARTFPWRRLRKVAANIRANTRAGVLRQGGDRARARSGDRAWGLTCPVDPTAPFWTGLPDPTAVVHEPTAAEELLDVLDWACRRDVITTDDRALLLSLVQAAERTVVSRSRRGHGGLMANQLSDQVARRWGVSPITVRRRARRSMLALAEACRHGRYETCA